MTKESQEMAERMAAHRAEQERLGLYFTERIEQMQLKEADYHLTDAVTLNDTGEDHFAKADRIPLLVPETGGGIRIRYFALNRHEMSYATGETMHPTRPFYRTRLHPEKVAVKGRKYSQPFASGVRPFLPPALIDAYRDKTRLPLLAVTEGELKALKATAAGIPTLGLGGINSFGESASGAEQTDKEREKAAGEYKPLLKEIKDIVKTCKVDDLVFVMDADAFQPDADALAGKHNFTHRPWKFLGAALAFRDAAKALDCNLYIAVIHEAAGGKGLDDILVAQGNDPAAIVAQLRKLDKAKQFFHIHTLRGREDVIKKWWGVANPDALLARYGHLMQDGQRFILHHKPFVVAVNADTGKLSAKRETTPFSKEALATLPKGVDEADVLEYQLYEDHDKHETWSVVTDEQDGMVHIVKRQRIANFTVRIPYLLWQKGDPRRIVELVNNRGLKVQTELDANAFSNRRAFSTACKSDGNFRWRGTDEDLENLQAKLFEAEKRAVQINVLGYNAQEDYYAFGNGLWADGKWHEADEDGIVTIGEGGNSCYFLPAFSSLYKEAKSDYENERRFVYQPTTTTLKDWSDTFFSSYGQNGRIGFLFLLASLFRDIVMRRERVFPLLFAYGLPSSGKSTMGISLMRMFGEPIDAVMLGGSSTRIGFMRSLAQRANALIRFDEAQNLDERTWEQLKNIYDGMGPVQGVKSNDNRTKTTPVLSSVYVAGEQMPTANAAFAERVLLLTFTHDQQNPEALPRLLDMEAAGISGLLPQLLALRTHFEAGFVETLRAARAEIRNLLGPEAKERIVLNHALLLATYDICLPHLTQIALSRETVVSDLVALANKQLSVLAANNNLAKFWDVVEVLHQQRKIKAPADFKFDGDKVFIRMSNVHAEYVQHCIKTNQNYIQKSSLTDYLEKSAAFRGKVNARFGDTSKTSSLAFHYESLGIDLMDIDPINEQPAATKPMGTASLPDANVPF